MKKYKIYHLSHPITSEIRYVGATTVPLKQRLSCHKHAAFTKKVNTHVANWIRLINCAPVITLIEECLESEWEDREKYWISQYNNLTNIREGGKGIIVDRSIDSIQRSANGHKKKVIILDYDYNFIKEFESISDCAIFLKGSITSVSNALKRGQLNNSHIGMSGNYLILYEKDYKFDNYTKVYKKAKKEVFQYSLEGKLIKKFNNVTEALNTVKPCKYISGILESLKRRDKCGGYYWSYNKIDDFHIFLKGKRIPRKIIRKSDNKTFNSFIEIKKEYNARHTPNSFFFDQFKRRGFIFWKNSYWEIVNLL